MVRVDLGVLLEPAGVELVVRHRVVGVGHPHLGVALRGLLAPDQVREHAGDVGLERERLEVEHQAGVLGERVGNAHRPREVLGQVAVAGLRLDPLDAALDLAHRVEVLARPPPVAGPEALLEPGHVLAHRVEDAAVLAQSRRALVAGAALAEQALEHHPRVVLHRQGGGRRAPRDGVGVDAAVAVVAVADHVAVLERDLERRQRRVLPQRGGRDLVGGGAGADVGALGALGVHAVEPDPARPRVLAVAVAPRLGLPVGEAGGDDHVVLDGGEGTQDRRQLQGAVGGRRPLRHVGPVRDVDEAEPLRRPRRGAGERGGRGHHGVEQGQRQRGAGASEKRAAGQRHLRDDHDSVLLIRNGGLSTTPRMSVVRR